MSRRKSKACVIHLDTYQQKQNKGKKNSKTEKLKISRMRETIQIKAEINTAKKAVVK